MLGLACFRVNIILLFCKNARTIGGCGVAEETQNKSVLDKRLESGFYAFRQTLYPLTSSGISLVFCR